MSLIHIRVNFMRLILIKTLLTRNELPLPFVTWSTDESCIQLTELEYFVFFMSPSMMSKLIELWISKRQPVNVLKLFCIISLDIGMWSLSQLHFSLWKDMLCWKVFKNACLLSLYNLICYVIVNCFLLV